MHTQIQRAIELAQSGRRDQALYLLREVLSVDPNEAMAWKWLSYLSPDPNEALTAAYRVLDLNPGDRWAYDSLPALQARARAQTSIPAPRPVPVSAKPTLRTQPVRPRIGLLPALGMLLAVVACIGAAVLSIVFFNQMSDTQDLTQIVVTHPPYVGAATESAPQAGIIEPATKPTDVPTPTSALPATPQPQAQAGASGQSALGFLPNVEISSRVTNYFFTATTEEEIRHQLYNNGPRLDDAGMSAIAMASYRIWAEWSAYQTGTCDVTDATVYLDIEYTYPDWQPTADTPDYLFPEWERFITHVMEHEQEHGAIAEACAYEVAQQMAEAGAVATCSDLGAYFDTVIQQVYAACDAQQAAFDADEGHTTFPLP